MASIWVIEEWVGGKWIIRCDRSWLFATRKEAERFVFHDGGMSRRDFRASKYIRKPEGKR